MVWIIVGISEAIAVACLVFLWRQTGTLIRKMFWSVALIVPIVGPLFFGALFRPLRPVPDEIRQTSPNADAFNSGPWHP